MQTILGASGQIAIELAKNLAKNHTQNIRLVSRNPQKVNEKDELFAADLLDLEKTKAAIAGSEIVYFTVGLPMNTQQWIVEFPTLLQNVITACEQYGAKLVFFDNTYMLPMNGDALTENSPFMPQGKKAKVRADMANMVLNAIKKGNIKAMICRAPEFYGPDKTQSITNALIFNKIKNNQKATVLLSDKTKRSLIFTPDASRAMALIANTPNTFGQTWNLPCADESLDYQQFISLIEKIFGKKIAYKVVPKWQLQLAGIFNSQLKEIAELLPRYAQDNIFSSEKFKKAFPDFVVTSYESGIRKTLGL